MPAECRPARFSTTFTARTIPVPGPADERLLFSDPRLHVLSMMIPVANNALQAVGVGCRGQGPAGAPLVYCGVGDGATQQGEFLEACAEAVRERVPVLFVVQDNRYAISTGPRAGRFTRCPPGRPTRCLRRAHPLRGRPGRVRRV